MPELEQRRGRASTEYAFSVTDLLSAVLKPPPVQNFRDLTAWWEDHRSSTAAIARPIDQAILGATRVDRIGYAFAAGYQAALRALVPSLPPEALVSLAASELGGAHPRAIQCTLIEQRLTGKKEWVSGGPSAVLLVVAALPEQSTEHPRLVVVRLPSDRAGLRFETPKPAPFIPEIPHASLRLEAVLVESEEVLPGDGYLNYLKPFRTIEDIHVHAALLAHLGAVLARAADPDRPLLERILAALACARALAAEDPTTAGTHLALAGLIGETQRLLLEIEPKLVGDATIAARFQRDRPLFAVAGKAREKRREAAWSKLG